MYISFCRVRHRSLACIFELLRADTSSKRIWRRGGNTSRLLKPIFQWEKVTRGIWPPGTDPVASSLQFITSYYPMSYWIFDARVIPLDEGREHPRRRMFTVGEEIDTSQQQCPRVPYNRGGEREDQKNERRQSHALLAQRGRRRRRDKSVYGVVTEMMVHRLGRGGHHRAAYTRGSRLTWSHMLTWWLALRYAYISSILFLATSWKSAVTVSRSSLVTSLIRILRIRYDIPSYMTPSSFDPYLIRAYSNNKFPRDLWDL